MACLWFNGPFSASLSVIETGKVDLDMLNELMVCLICFLEQTKGTSVIDYVIFCRDICR